MKVKKIMPVFAIALGLVLALATSAFKQAPKDQNGVDTYLFEYDISQPYDVSHVQDKANWDLNQNAAGCDQTNQEACTIRVPESDVDNPGPSATLKSSFSITAATNSSTGTAYVSSLSDMSAQKFNKTAE
ncbi:MAG: DUF6520 family protein [Ginsengibacter sp.]